MPESEEKKAKDNKFLKIIKWIFSPILAIGFLLFLFAKLLMKLCLIEWLVFVGLTSAISIYCYELVKTETNLKEIAFWSLPAWVVILIGTILLILIGCIITINTIRRKNVVVSK